MKLSDDILHEIKYDWVQDAEAVLLFTEWASKACELENKLEKLLAGRATMSEIEDWAEADDGPEIPPNWSIEGFKK